MLRSEFNKGAGVIIASTLLGVPRLGIAGAADEVQQSISDFTVVLLPGRGGSVEPWLRSTKEYLESIGIPTKFPNIPSRSIPRRGEFLLGYEQVFDETPGRKKVLAFSASSLVLAFSQMYPLKEADITCISVRKSAPQDPDMREFYMSFNTQRVRDNVNRLTFLCGGKKDFLHDTTIALAREFGQRSFVYDDADHGGIVGDLSKIDWIVRNS